MDNTNTLKQSLDFIGISPIQGVSIGFELDSWQDELDTEHYIHIDAIIFRITLTFKVRN